MNRPKGSSKEKTEKGIRDGKTIEPARNAERNETETAQRLLEEGNVGTRLAFPSRTEGKGGFRNLPADVSVPSGAGLSEVGPKFRIHVNKIPSKSATEASSIVQLTLDGQSDGCQLVKSTELVFKAIVSVDSDLKLKVSCIEPGDDFGPLHFHDVKVPGCPTSNIVEKPNPKAPYVTDSFEVELCSSPGTATIEFKADLVHTIFVGKQRVKLGTDMGTTNEWKEICFDVDLPLMNTMNLSSTNASLRCLSTVDGSCNSPELGTFWDFEYSLNLPSGKLTNVSLKTQTKDNEPTLIFYGVRVSEFVRSGKSLVMDAQGQISEERRCSKGSSELKLESLTVYVPPGKDTETLRFIITVSPVLSMSNETDLAIMFSFKGDGTQPNEFVFSASARATAVVDENSKAGGLQSQNHLNYMKVTHGGQMDISAILHVSSPIRIKMSLSAMNVNELVSEELSISDASIRSRNFHPLVFGKPKYSRNHNNEAVLSAVTVEMTEMPQECGSELFANSEISIIVNKSVADSFAVVFMDQLTKKVALEECVNLTAKAANCYDSDNSKAICRFIVPGEKRSIPFAMRVILAVPCNKTKVVRVLRGVADAVSPFSHSVGFLSVGFFQEMVAVEEGIFPVSPRDNVVIDFSVKPARLVDEIQLRNSRTVEGKWHTLLLPNARINNAYRFELSVVEVGTNYERTFTEIIEFQSSEMLNLTQCGVVNKGTGYYFESISPFIPKNVFFSLTEDGGPIASNILFESDSLKVPSTSSTYTCNRETGDGKDLKLLGIFNCDGAPSPLDNSPNENFTINTRIDDKRNAASGKSLEISVAGYMKGYEVPWPLGTFAIRPQQADDANPQSCSRIESMEVGNGTSLGGFVPIVVKFLATPGNLKLNLTVSTPKGAKAVHAAIHSLGSSYIPLPSMQLTRRMAPEQAVDLTWKTVFELQDLYMMQVDPKEEENYFYLDVYLAVEPDVTESFLAEFLCDCDRQSTSSIEVLKLPEPEPDGEVAGFLRISRGSPRVNTWYSGTEMSWDAIIILPGNYPRKSEEVKIDAIIKVPKDLLNSIRICRMEISFIGEMCLLDDANLKSTIAKNNS
ncbi:unnamed protein product [Darwinula stevensoni]|uniref:Uncharacterized protein n=1 Tax=Darwinula stevensoni TaxID=69355 RepID=A0A7R8XIS2_9CRUS|nr:unnamed protein product [Darwinula stevensoni]CAG0894568.1 unnamed protein product [Darwinula stevensoni]